MKKEYLGDGVYAHFDGWHVVLSTARESGMHWIALEPEVQQSLKKYITRIYAELENEEGTNDEQRVDSQSSL
mgnify:CR=1 FL=1